MSLAPFITQLLEHGHVQVGAWDDAPHDDDPELDPELDAVLSGFERQWRLEFPRDPPAFFLPAARWAAAAFYRACQLAAYRALGEEQVAAALAVACPAGDAAERHYSVDLVLRFLPDLARLAAGIAPGDPLVVQLRDWGGRWPLSSVGMKSILVADLEPIARHPALLGCYVDRVLARDDPSRLDDPRIRAAADAALGAFPSLAKRPSDAR